MSHCTCDYHQEQNKKSEWDISDNGIQWSSDDFFKAKEKYMKYWENAVCNHDDDFHADCFACGFKFCKEMKAHYEKCREKDTSSFHHRGCHNKCKCHEAKKKYTDADQGPFSPSEEAHAHVVKGSHPVDPSEEDLLRIARESSCLQRIQMKIWDYMKTPMPERDCVEVAMEIFKDVERTIKG